MRLKRSLLKNLKYYLIADWSLCPNKEIFQNRIKTAVSCGCTAVQLRAKNLDTDNFLILAEKIKSLLENKALFIVNDRVDIVVASNADGVHLGQDDIPIMQARQILGSSKIIGLSTHNIIQAFKAAHQGADYIAVGPVFKTGTKPKLKAIGIDIFDALKNIKAPIVSVGGINSQRIYTLKNKGVRNFAFASYVMCAHNIKHALNSMKQALKV